MLKIIGHSYSQFFFFCYPSAALFTVASVPGYFLNFVFYVLSNILHFFRVFRECLLICLFALLTSTYFFSQQINLIWLEGRQVSIAIFPRLGIGAQDQHWSTSFIQQGYVSEPSVLQALRISGLNDSRVFYWNYIFVETSRVWSLCLCYFSISRTWHTTWNNTVYHQEVDEGMNKIFEVTWW